MAEEFPNNSNRAKESSLVRDTVDDKASNVPVNDTHPRVTQNTAPVRKRSTVHEVFHAIFPGGFEEIKQHLVWDIFIPWMQDMLHNGWQGLGDVIFPGSGRNTSAAGASIPERYSYNEPDRFRDYNYYSSSNGYRPAMKRPTTRERCLEIIETLEESIMRVGYATLLEFNAEIGAPTYSTQNDYGWMSIKGVKPIQVRGGWIIQMPKAVPIDDARRY